MTTSGTYNFNPSLGEMVLSAYSRVRVKRTELLAQHMIDARMEANLLLVEWANKQPNLWTVTLGEEALVEGVNEIVLSPTVIEIMDAYIRLDNGGSSSSIQDRMIFPMSRTDYASIPNKEMQAPPTTFWFDRQLIPKIRLWPTPDGNGPYTLRYYYVRQIEDANLPAGLGVQQPYRFCDAFVAGLAHRLARHYAPDMEQMRKLEAAEAWRIAANEDQEFVPLMIMPAISGYYRR